MPRKAKTNRIGPLEEAENAKALDAAAGVPPLQTKAPDAGIAVDGRAPATEPTPPPLVPDTKEKLLYKYALEGPNISEGFFRDFTDSKELAELVCMMGIRRMAVVIAKASFEEADVKDFSALMRIILNIAYGETASMDPNKFLPEVHVGPSIPTGGTEGIEASLEKIKRLATGGKR